MIFYILVCVLMFALAILIHEFGHFIVALKLGLRVEAFSIGFGPILWRRRVRGVEYRISLLPLGGYVSIPDIDPEGTKALEGASGEVASRLRIPAWKELCVALAGPIMNVVLAVVLATILALVPSIDFGELPARIGAVLPGGPAEKSGLRVGDRVVSIAGHEVETWTQLMTEVQIGGGAELEFRVEGADGEMRSLSIKPEQDKLTEAWFIMALSCSNATGIVHHWLPVRNPIRQVAWDAGSIFRVLKALVTPRNAKATSKSLGGPVMIAEGLYRQMRRDPWDGIGFLRFINVNLAVFNLLPIPVLDGGLILFSLISLVFRRRVPDAVVRTLSMFFMVVLLMLICLLVWRDGVKSFKIHTFKPQEAVSNVHTNTDTCAESR